MKKMIKSVLAFVAAVFVGSAAWAADIVVEKAVTLSHGTSAILKDNGGQPISWADGLYSESSDERIAKVIKVDDYVAVTNEVRDGLAEVYVDIGDDSYKFTVSCMTIELEKTIKPDPSDKSNATIRVTSHVLTGVHEIPTNQILFASSLCGNHTLKLTTIEGAINNLAQKGAVDWYIFANTKTSPQPTYTKTNSWGRVEMNKKATGLPNALVTSSHCNLVAYLTMLDQSLGEVSKHGTNRKYDYIVLMFDSNRLASFLHDADRDAATHYGALAERVAKKLKWYYDNKRVIWIVDPKDSSENANDPTNKAGKFYTPSTFYYSSGSKKLEDDEFDLLGALLDPEGYLNGKKWDTTTYSGYKAAKKNDQQGYYDDLTEVTKILNQYVHSASYSTAMSDSIVNSTTLGFKGGVATSAVRFYTWPDNKPAPTGECIADCEGWVESKDTPKVDGCAVSISANIQFETWTKLEIDVVDNGGFLKYCIGNGIAVPVEGEPGKFAVNPNDGEAEMTLKSVIDGKEAGELARGSQDMMNRWILELPEFEFTVSGFERPYDGTSTNVTVSVTDKESHKELEPSLYNLAYSTDGTTWKTNTVDNFYAAFKDVIDTPVDVKVVITGDDTYKPSDEPKSATLKITPLTVTVTAGTGSKTYDSKAADLSETTWSFSGTFADGEQDDIEALISAGITNKQGKTKAFVLKDGSVNAGTYDITTNTVLTANQNYNVNFTPGTFTINPAQIKGFHFGDKFGYDAETAPKVLAENVDCYVEGLPAGGTNITVKLFKAFGTDTFTPNDFSENRIEVGVYTNWCTVSGGDNYLSTNVCAEIIIRKREPEVAGDTPAANETEVKGTLLEIAKGIANTKNPKPIYAEAQLTVDNATGSGDETEIKNKFLEEKKTGNVENVQSASYDIKLGYTEDYKDPKNWEDIGSSNNTKIKIVLDCPLVKTAEKVEVWRKHNGAISKANWTDGTASVDKSKGQVTINASKFSVYTVITYSIPPPECGPCNPCPEEEVAPTLVYKVQMNLKTTKGVTTHETVNKGSICTPGEDEDVCNVYRTKDATKLVGWIYDCTATCDTIANGSVVIWDAKRKAPFADGAALTTAFINVMGKKQAEAEWAWTFSGTADYSAFDAAATQVYTLTGAGLGKFSKAKGYYTSFSGRVAGTVTASWDLKTKKNNCCISSQIAKCDELATLVDAQDTIAYGTWSAKYDSSASKRYAKNGYLKLPSYVK